MANWKGTVVPNTGYVEKVYFNTSLSDDEVLSELQKLTYEEESGAHFLLLKSNQSSILYAGMQNGIFGIGNLSTNEIYWTENGEVVGTTFTGWNPEFNGEIQIDGEVVNNFNGLGGGIENDKISSLFSITPFTQDEPITNLPEFLTGIADAIREVKGTNEKVNAQNFKPEILKFKELIGSGEESVEIVELTATENGTYDSISIYEQAKIDQNTEFDFALPVEILGIPLNVKKIEGLPFPTNADDINGGKYTINIKQNGEIVELESQTLTDVYYDEEMMAYASNDLRFALLWVVDSTALNQMLGSSYFENNSIYMSDQFIQMAILQGTQIDEWEAICDIYSGEKSVAFKPVTVNVKPKIIDTLTVTKNGIYTVPETNDGYKSVDVQIPLQETLYISENGTYTPNEGYEGIKKFVVLTPTPRGYIIGDRIFETDIDVISEGYYSVIMSGQLVTTDYQFAGATFQGNVDFSNLNAFSTPVTKIFLKEGSFAGCEMSDVKNGIIFPSSGLTTLTINDKCFSGFKYLTKIDTGEVSSNVALGKWAFSECENLETVIINAPELYYDVATWKYRMYETFRNCTNLKEVVFKNYAGVVFPPMNSFPDNDDLLIYFPDEIVESFKTSIDWAELADKIRPLSEYENKPTPYLTFSSPSTFTLNIIDNIKYWDGKLEYSTDASTWSEWSGTSAISSSADGKLYMRGTGNTKITASTSWSRGAWVLTGNDISCSGNIENLLDYQTVANGEHPTMATYCYSNMFNNCQGLISAPELGAITLTNYCYYYMFSDCGDLKYAPKINATTLASNCCQNMFSSSTNLETLPKLHATTLAYQCYRNMFSGCSNIKLSTTQTDEYINEYRIPISGTGTMGTDSLAAMFKKTGGTYTGNTGTVSINTTYYTSNEVV